MYWQCPIMIRKKVRLTAVNDMMLNYGTSNLNVLYIMMYAMEGGRGNLDINYGC